MRSMADHYAHRATWCREHATRLTVEATRDINKDLRQHMLDLAATYQRVADQMISQPPDPDQGLPYWW